MTPEIQGLLDKAKQSTEAAQSLLADNYVDFAASRAYYAIFYALEALLLSKNLSFSKHSAVISAFGKEYVKSGVFDPRFHRAAIDAFDLRNAGDYGTMHAVSEELASQTIQNARELIQTVSSYIEELSRPKGFTLVELAVSLVVIGLLIGLGTAMVGPLMNSIKVRESRENLGAAVESINGWASGNNRLPDNSTGNSYSFASVVRTPADAWGRNFIYLYDNNLASGTITKDTICGRRSTTLSLTDSSSGATIPNVAYIIFSYSDDAESNTTLTSGTLTPAPVNPPKIEASSYVATGNAATVSADTANDLVRWVTLDELRTKVGCQGPQLRIINNELPYGAVPNAYSATIIADGGVPFGTGPNTYKWCTSTLPTGFVQTGGVADANCQGLTENSWAAASAGLTISFPASTTTSGTHQLTVVVRDFADSIVTSPACNNAAPGDNCAQKTFVLTINPQ